jgi:hypothetical protein
MTDERAEGTPARYIDLALVAVACLILVGAHFFGRGTAAPVRGTGVDWDTVPSARPQASGPPSSRQALELPDAVGKARSLLPGVRDADAVKSDLRNVVIVQEVYFSENSTYATTTEQLLPVGLTLRSGATVTLLHGSQAGWAASAARPDAPGVSCVVFIGKQPTDSVPATMRDGRRGSEGFPVCDGDR